VKACGIKPGPRANSPDEKKSHSLEWVVNLSALRVSFCLTLHPCFVLNSKECACRLEILLAIERDLQSLSSQQLNFLKRSIVLCRNSASDSSMMSLVAPVSENSPETSAGEEVCEQSRMGEFDE